MRLFTFAAVAALLVAGFSYAQEGDKPAKKLGRTVGVLTKIDGDKLTVTSMGDAGEKVTEFTTTEKTKYFKQLPLPKKDAPKKEGEKAAEDKKPMPMREPISKDDVKAGMRVAVTAGEDKVAASVVVLPGMPKKAKDGK